MAKLTFCGGALSVTGSNYLLETKKSKIIVDCGMLQGSEYTEKDNFKSFNYEADKIDAVIVTHAHIDHIGRVPKLVKEGFEGPIYATSPTVDLAEIMLKDSQDILEMQSGKNKDPLYSKEDVENTKTLFKKVEYGETIQITKDIKVRFRDAGHILGSAIIEVWVKEKFREKKLVFSGDLGNPPTPFLNPTEYIDDADYVLVETTYGNRIHEDKKERRDLLENAVEATQTNKGVLMLPVFALERTQQILFELNYLFENNKVPPMPVFLDSPLAIDATAVYRKYKREESYFNESAQEIIEEGRKLFHFSCLETTYETEESKAINEVDPPKVIIAGSGMSTGGRILHHEIRYLSDPNSMFLVVGYQAKGTLGRKILDGVKEVKIHGEIVPVRCQIRAIGGYSAHADQNGLYKWVDHIRKGGKLKKVFCVQGEEEPATAFAVKLRDHMAVDAVVPKEGDVFEF